MQFRKKIIIDTATDTEAMLNAQFNDAAVDGFETKPVAGFTKLPCFGDMRCYGRMVGQRDVNGWSLTEEFFYGKGQDVPQVPKISLASVVAVGITDTEAARRAAKFNPPDLDDWF